MKALRFAWKTFIEGWREPQLLGLLLFFPALMIMIYYLAFNGSGQGFAGYLRVLVIDQDAGTAGPRLVEALKSEQYEGKPIFNIDVMADLESAKTILNENKAALLIVIPRGFSGQLQAGRSQHSPASLQFIGDQSSDLYNFAYGFAVSAAEKFTGQSIGVTRPEFIRYEFLKGTGTLSDFQLGVPGVITFGVMFGVIYSAIILVREDRRGTLKRLSLAGLSALGMIAGIAIEQMAMALIQIPLAFATALLFGFQSPGSLLAAILIGFILSLSATGMGLVAACFSHDPGEATNLATGIMAPLVFLSGAIFPMPSAPLFTIAGRTIQAYDVMPTRHATEALRKILIYGDGLSSIPYELVALVFLSLIYLSIGIVIYQRRRLRAAYG